MSSWGDSAVSGLQRVRALVFGLVCLVIGGCLIPAPFFGDYPVWESLLGFMTLTFGIASVGQGLPARRSTEISLHRTVIGLRVAPALFMLLITLPFAVLLVYLTTRGGAGWLAAPFALLFLSFAPDTIQAIVRRPRLVLDDEGLTLRGWQNDVYLPRASIVRSRLDLWRGQMVLRVEADGPVAGWRGSRHRRVWALEPPLRDGALEVRLSAFPAMRDVEEIRRQLPPYL